MTRVAGPPWSGWRPAGHLFGSTNGIGYLMNNAYANYDMTELWSGIVLLGILEYVLAWHRGARQLAN